MPTRLRTIYGFVMLAIELGQSLMPNKVDAQIRAGSAYLKIAPGTRQLSLANSLTGALDGTYSLYANPAATGLLREWQWSGSYTNWIADIFNVSMLYGTQFRLSKDLKMSFASGINYQGVGDFDATDGKQPPASANDLLLITSFGLPITSIPGNLSFGANFKYLRSKLNQHDASTVIVDFGALYRSRRIRMSEPGRGLFEYGIISAGVSLNQFGPSMKFIAEKTPLPTMFRAGLALNLGTHDGIQIQVAGDYQNVKDEVSRFSLGTELINIFSPLSKELGRLVTLRGGYNFNSGQHDDFVSKFSLGLSIRLDDYMSQPTSGLTPRNTALRFDLGALTSSRFSNVSQGSVTYRPIRPERFEFAESKFQSFQLDKPPEAQYAQGDTVTLSWEASRDPDLYDDVNYLLFVSHESADSLLPYLSGAKINDKSNLTLRRHVDGNDRMDSSQVRLVYLSSRVESINGIVANESRRDSLIYETEYFPENANLLDYSLFLRDTGNFYWTVIAYDRNNHVRVIEKSGNHIARFYVKPPDLKITLLPLKTSGHFEAEIMVANVGSTAVDDSFVVEVVGCNQTQFDSIVFEPVLEGGPRVYRDIIRNSERPLKISGTLSPPGSSIDTWEVNGLGTGENVTKTVPWSHDYSFMFARLDPDNRIPESNEDNNLDFDALPDDTSHVEYDLEIKKSSEIPPSVSRVHFDPTDSTLTKSAEIELERLASVFTSQALKDACIKIEGHSDQQGWRGRDSTRSRELNLKLSQGRARSVRDYLVRHGIASTRIQYTGFGQSQPLIPNALTSEDHERNRRVEIFLVRKTCTSDVLANCAMGNRINCREDTVRAVSVGDSFQYILIVKNLGRSFAEAITVIDSIPNYITPSNCSVPIDRSKSKLSENVLVWTLDLAPDSVKIIKHTATVAASLPDTFTQLVNTSALSAPGDTTAIVDRDTVYAIGGKAWQLPDLTISLRPKQIGPQQFVGEIVVRNIGPTGVDDFFVAVEPFELTQADKQSTDLVPHFTSATQHFAREHLAKGRKYTKFVDWPTDKSHMRASVDPDNRILESDEDNNLAFAALPNPKIEVWHRGNLIQDGQSSRVDFGTTRPGSPKRETFTIKNVGNATLTLSNPHPDSLPGFSVVGLFPGSIEPLKGNTLEIQLDAQSGGNFSGNVIFRNNSNENPFNFQITGTVVDTVRAAKIQMFDGRTEIKDGQKSAVDFGKTTVGSPKHKTFTIKSVGSTTLTLTWPLRWPAGFTLMDSLPRSVEPGDSATFRIRLDAGHTFDGPVSFGTNDSSLTNPFDFQIAGKVSSLTWWVIIILLISAFVITITLLLAALIILGLLVPDSWALNEIAKLLTRVVKTIAKLVTRTSKYIANRLIKRDPGPDPTDPVPLIMRLQRHLDYGNQAVQVQGPLILKEETPITVVSEDDLTRIEGIGPEIARRLQASGINTYGQLGDADIDRLKELLTITMADPSTWPQQAKLAASGRWDDLDKWQEELRGGRKV